MVFNRGRRKPRICLICSHEILFINNDEDFSWDMHKQEENHKKSRLKGNQRMSEKANTHMCIQRMEAFFGSSENIEKRVNELIYLADKEFKNVHRNEIVIREIARVFADIYPGEFTIRPFGSRITGLTTREYGDLDLFIDTSCETADKTLIESPEMENYFLRKLADHMEKKEEDIWVNVCKVLACRTPIVKVLHYDTKMQCDITVMNRLGNINTQLMSTYINNINKFRPMILMIREWSSDCDYVKNINNYALSLLVLFYLQQENYAPAVYAFEFDYHKPRTNISGYECLDYSEVEFDWNTVKSTRHIELKQLLVGFFSFYANFNFRNFVICPLMGKALQKNLFTANGKKLPAEMIAYVMKLKNRGELFQLTDKGMNIQDPIDLAHNVTKSTREAFLKDFIDMCDSSKRALDMLD